MDNARRAEAVPIIDHVGIAVNSLDEGIRLYRALLGTDPPDVETIVSEGVRVVFFGNGPGRVELLEPTDDASPIARFLARSGPGLHHVCLRVPDLDAALAGAARSGALPVPPGVRRGAGGSRIAFLHPRGAGGVLLELREETSGMRAAEEPPGARPDAAGPA